MYKNINQKTQEAKIERIVRANKFLVKEDFQGWCKLKKISKRELARLNKAGLINL